MIKIYFEMFQWQLNFVMMPIFDIITWCNNTRALLVVGSLRSRKWVHAFHWVSSFSESKRSNYYERMPVLRSADYVKKWYLNEILLSLKHLTINFDHFKKKINSEKLNNCYSPFIFKLWYKLTYLFNSVFIFFIKIERWLANIFFLKL